MTPRARAEQLRREIERHNRLYYNEAAPEISVRQLPGGKCVCLLHKGPYEQLGHSYAKILGYIKQKGYEIVMPTREIYVKGPGMIFKGNPANYLTEIQIVVGGA